MSLHDFVLLLHILGAGVVIVVANFSSVTAEIPQELFRFGRE